MVQKVILRGLFLILGLGAMGLIFGVGIIFYFTASLPKIESLNDYRPALSSQILSKDGDVLAEIGKEIRELVEMDEVPQLIIDAFLSAEDSNFYEHTGVDYAGVLRAALANLKAGRVVQGGSTITQQVAKSLLLTSERSIARKIKDFLLAQKIEEKFSKEEILYLYLNQVYLGGGYYGVKAAVRGYFGKELSEASIAESAMIAGLLVAPGRYSPYIRPQFAKSRQAYVLSRMLQNNKITEEQYQEAVAEQIKYYIRKPREFRAAYFTDWIRQRVVNKIGEEEFLTGGYRVHTTLDWDLQQVAEKEVLAGVKEIDKRQGFKGVLSTLVEENIEEFKLNGRKKILEEYSEFFTLGEDNQRVYQYQFDETQVEQIREKEIEWEKKFKRSRFKPGFVTEDPLLPTLSRSELYEAVVTYVDDLGRMVYISIGGVSGIIPYEYFRWAHERVISNERKFYPYVTRPSTILKRGDVVHVSIVNSSVKIYGHATDELKKLINQHPEASTLKEEKYLLCLLDQKPDAQGALLSLDPQNGNILAFVGGADFKISQFNRVIQSRRQPGSSFKSLLYAAALEYGFNPATIILDSPESLGGVDESLNWKPRNYDGRFMGPMTFRNSLELSRNIPTIKIAERVGVKRTLEFMERIGFNAKLDRDLSLALGSFGVSLLDIVSTYAIFPNGGKMINPKSLVSVFTREGEELSMEDQVVTEAEADTGEYSEQEVAVEDIVESEELIIEEEGEVNPFHVALGGDQVYDPRLAYIMTNLLRGAVLHGTGRSAVEISRFLGGKTGTTNNYVDSWFIGFSSNLVTGVWTGFDNNETLGFGETGARSALPIWKEFMREGIRKYGEQDYRQPLGIVNVRIDKKTGRLATPGAGQSFEESFVEGFEPGSVQKVKNDNPDDFSPILGDDDYYDNQ